MPTTEIVVEPAASVTSNALGVIQPKSSLSVAGLKFRTGLLPQAQVIFVVVPVVAAAVSDADCPRPASPPPNTVRTC